MKLNRANESDIKDKLATYRSEKLARKKKKIEKERLNALQSKCKLIRQ